MALQSIYTSHGGEQHVRQWCRDRLSAWATPHEVSTLETSLGVTTVVTAGQGPAVVLLAGTNFCAATMLEVADALAPTRQVILADLPGQPGLSSSQRPRRERVTAYGRWTEEVMKKAVSGPAVLVGHSLGAAVALATTPGPHLAGLVLVSPAGLSRARLTPAVLRATLPWIAAPSPARSRALLNLMSGQAPHSAGTDQNLVEWMTLVARHTRTSLAPPPLPGPLLRRWAGTPVLVATGTQDCFYPLARIAGSARALLGTEAIALPGVGHLGPHEDPALLTALLDRLDTHRE
ncbi:alpha/beta fold hydrolase [Nonomuraea sp. H19]|uniref:alpha/beta fold hydrolase n=1 Tax=Nonomuraea sp. H19 TaxID=3452206 RepID=UPI003F8AAC54